MADAAPEKPFFATITNLDVGIRHCHTEQGQVMVPVNGAVVAKVTQSQFDAIKDDSPRNDEGDPMFEIAKASKDELAAASQNDGTSGGPKPLDQLSLGALKKIAKEEEADVSQATTAAEFVDAINAKRAAAQ